MPMLSRMTSFLRNIFAQRRNDVLIADLARDDGIAYISFFPLGGCTPLQSATLSDVATRLGATPRSAL